MGYGRRRGRYTDPNKAGTIQSEVLMECSNLLLRYFKPILRSCPAGDLTGDGDSGKCGERMYHTLIAANDTFADMQRYLNSFRDADVFRVCSHENSPTMLPVAIVLKDQPALNVVQLVEMESSIGRNEALAGVMTGIPVTTQLLERFTCTSPAFASTSKWYYRKGGYFCDVAGTAGNGNVGVRSDGERPVAPTTAVLEVVLPLKIPDGKKLYMHRLMSSFRSVSIPALGGVMPESTNGLYITHTHPDYEKWCKWGIAAYQMEMVYNRWSFELHRMFSLVNTVGQLKRLFPVIESLITHPETKARLASAKQQSAMPDELTARINAGESYDETAARYTAYKTMLLAVSELLTRAVLAPSLTAIEKNVVSHFDSRWWSATEGDYRKITW